MQVGFGNQIITPPLGIEMAGYFSNRLASGVKDDLYSRAIVVSEGETHVAVVVTDLIHFPKDDAARVRALVAERTSIPADNVMVVATHTHTGPVTRFGKLRDEDYMLTWAENTAEAVRIAFESRIEATVGGGIGELPGVAFNRRFWMNNGVVHTNPGRRNPNIIGPAGPADDEVIVLRFDDADGRPIGILTNFSCHTDTVGGTELSGDWVGVTERTIRSMLPHLFKDPSHIDVDNFGIIVMNGACGDINHIDAMDHNPNKNWPGMTEAIGGGLAAETLRVAMGIETTNPNGETDTQHVASASTQVGIQRIPFGDRIEQCKRAIEDDRVGRMEKTRAKSIVASAENQSPDVPEQALEEEVEVQVIQIGPAAILGLPAETFAESGIHFKENVPHAFGMIANLANGSLGYLPPIRAYREGGYETRSARYQPGSIDEMVSAGVNIAHQCYAGNATK